MNILLVNQDWFAEELRELGHTVHVCGYLNKLEIMLPVPVMHLSEVLDLLPKGFHPDLMLFHDNSAPITILGIEQCDIPTVFYSVDVHHHFYFHKYLYHVFDCMFVAQKDYISDFKGLGCEPYWLPLYASKYVEKSEEKKHGAVFVGTMDESLNPDRVKFFNELNKKVPLLTTTGKWWEIFPYAEIVINQTVKGDLNFRVFEAMICGSLLLTEETRNGLLTIFENNKHLVTYSKGDVDDAAEKINYLLNHIKHTREIAKAGRDEILQKHLPIHRAQEIMEVTNGLAKRQSGVKNISAAMNHAVLYRRARYLDSAVAARAMVGALHAASQALIAEEAISEEVALYLSFIGIKYDQITGSNKGEQLLNKYNDLYPETLSIQVALVWSHLNRGEYDSAKKIASTIKTNEPLNSIYDKANTAVTSLLQSFS